jgi:hypothetical protein
MHKSRYRGGKMVVKKKDALIGIRKRELLRHPRITRYLEEAGIDAVNSYIACMRIYNEISRRGPVESYSQLSKKQKQDYDRVLRLSEKYPHISPLVDIARDLQNLIP